MTSTLGRLESMPVREVWAHEANDFTPWLAKPENLALLTETLLIGELSDQRMEVSVGSFYIDILAKDEAGGTVLIENQLSPTDHTHLGQIMTYLGGQGGHVTVVWIAESFREEHRAAIDWLNASTISGYDFFAVEVEVWKIGNSTPAQRFNIVGKPNAWSRNVTRASRAADDGQSDERSRNYAAYWTDFDAYLQEQKAPFKRPDRPRDYAYGLNFGRSGVWLEALAGIRDNRLSVQLLLWDRATAKHFFDLLSQDREAIDAEYGEPLTWLRLDGQIRSRVEIVTSAFNLSNREQWPEQHAWLLDNLLRFKQVFQDRVRNLKLPDTSSEPSGNPLEASDGQS